MSRKKLGLGACAVIILAACSSSSSAPPMVTQTGRIIQYQPCETDANAEGVSGATVTIGSESATTATDGSYSIQVPSGEPFTMRVTKTTTPSYVPLIEADDTVTGSYARGDTKFIQSGTATLLETALTGYDAGKALVTVEIVKTATCADAGGTTLTVSPSDANAVTIYPSACITPAGGGSSVTDGIFPAAVVYNLTPGKQTITATSPKCTQIPFPYTDPATGLTYDGTVTTEASGGISFLRIFMK